MNEYGHLEIHETIEELMVLANSIVAQTVYKSFPSCTLLRKHEPPPETKLDFLHDLCDYLKVPVNTQSNKMMAQSIQRVKSIPDRTKQDMLMILFRKYFLDNGLNV